MKMLQGFGKVDLPKLKWRSERRDGNARAMGGVLATWLVAVKRKEPGFWPLAPTGFVGTEKTAFSALRWNQSTLIRVGNISPGVPIFLTKLSLLWAAGIVVSNWLTCLFCFCFLAFYFLSWTDGAQYVGELKPQTTTSTNCELNPNEVEQH